MADIQDLMPQVIQYAPGVADAVALYALRQAANSFARATHAFLEQVDGVEAVAYDPIVTVEPSEANIAVSLHRVVMDGRQLWSRPERVEDLSDPGGDYTSAAPGTPRGIIQITPGTLRLLPAPAEDMTLDVTLVIAPRSDQDEIPDDMRDRYGDALVAGALNRIVRIPLQPFSSDPTPWAVTWHAAVTDARIDMNRSMSRGGLRVMPVGF